MQHVFKISLDTFDELYWIVMILKFYILKSDLEEMLYDVAVLEIQEHN